MKTVEKDTATKRKHTRTHTWTAASNAKAVINNVKKRNYNDCTDDGMVY